MLQRTPGTFYVLTFHRGPAPLNTALAAIAMKCQRCNAELPESIASGAIVACTACSARHQLETVASRAFSWVVAVPVVGVCLALWASLVVLAVRAVLAGISAPIVTFGLLALLLLMAYAGPPLWRELRGLAKPRELSCLEK